MIQQANKYQAKYQAKKSQVKKYQAWSKLMQTLGGVTIGFMD